MKHSLIILAALAASGCAFDGQMQNRIACTMAKDKAFVVSEYGPIGISAVIADKDREVICKN